MFSMTNSETEISLATPEDVRQASEKALHIWVGALSPLWAPFFAATATGLGLWSMGQAVRRSAGFSNLAAEAIGPGTHLFARWPGFALPFTRPWNRTWGAVAEKAEEISEAEFNSLAAPLQLVFEGEAKLEAVIDDAITTTPDNIEALTPQVNDLFSAAETNSRAPAQAVTKAAETIVETTEKAADTIEKTSDTGTEVAETAVRAAKTQTAKAVDAVAKSTEAIADTTEKFTDTAEKAAKMQTAKAADAVTKSAEAVVDTTEKSADTVKKAVDTGAEATDTVVKTAKTQTAKAADAVTKSARAVIDPVTETPVVPAVAEATAEKLPLPKTNVTPAPRKARKPKA